jgi:hypothetical protein
MIKHEEMIIEFGYASQDTMMRDESYEDMKRFHVDGAWWSGSYGSQFANKPKPEFNKLWRSINRVVGDINDMELNANIISNSDEATDESAGALQKRWRNDFQSSDGIEASEIATREAVVGGFGAIKVVSKYEDEEDPDPEKQYLCLESVSSACTSVYFNAGAIRKDKADATMGWHLIRCNRRTIEKEYGVDVVSFLSYSPKNETLITNDFNSRRDIFLAHYYEVVEKWLTTYDFSLMNGPVVTSGDGIKDEEGGKYTRDELKALRETYVQMFEEEAPTKRRKVKYTEYSLADGEKFLVKPQKMPFKRVPIIPRYGYYAELNGVEYYCGEVRKQKDAEMFHNVYGSSLMEIMSKPQVPKPEYLAEQIAKHASSRARADLDNVPFVLSDPAILPDGQAIVGPIGMTQPPMVGTGLQTAGAFLNEQLITGSAMGQATVPSSASGQAIQQVNERQDDALLPLVKNVLHSIRATCEAWIPAAQKLYFTNSRRIRVLEQDGKYSQLTTLEMTTTPEGETGPYGNNARGRYAVEVEQGEAYKDQRTAERESVLELLQYAGTDTEFGQLLTLQAMTLTNGEGTSEAKQIARYKMLDIMLATGVPMEDLNEEEEQYVAQKQKEMQEAAQNQPQDPMMMQAEASLILAQAEQTKAQTDYLDKQIDMYNAETQRTKVLGELEAKGIQLNQKEVEMQMKAISEVTNR